MTTRFLEVSQHVGIDHVYENGSSADRRTILESLGGGVALLDFERDGRIDLCFPGGGRFEGDSLRGEPTALFRQVDGGNFANVTRRAGLESRGKYTHGVAAADYDNDGFTDLLITGYAGVRLWRNMGDGTWIDATVAAALNDPSWSSSAGWGDVDGDGNLDLYVAHYVDWSFENNPPCTGPGGVPDVCPPRAFNGLDDTLFVSNGDGTFRDASDQAGLVSGGKGLGVILADLDFDRDLDIYVANDTTDNFLYVNDGAGRFEERGMISGTAVDDRGTANGSMGLEVTDYNGDGRPDLWVTNYEDETFGLYRNDGDANFFYASAPAGLKAIGTVYVGFGCCAGDFDLDGDEDVAVANGHVVHHPRNAPVLQRPLLFVNRDGRFHDASDAVGEYFAQAHAGRGLARGDLDGDGDLDLVFTNSGQPAAVVSNATKTSGGALSVRLVGRRSNRDGIGARLVLKTSRGTLCRCVAGGGSYLSTSDLTTHFGIPPGETIEQLVVYWPSGRISRLDAEAIASSDQRISTVTVREPDPEACP